jgi:hypothetical protein
MPADFWRRVRPSQLVATLAMNSERAAHAARDGGRPDVAAIKYVKAVQYLQLSLSEYAGDEEMSAWTQTRFRECLAQVYLLGDSAVPAEWELLPPPGWLLFLHQQLVARQNRVALVNELVMTRKSCKP